MSLMLNIWCNHILNKVKQNWIHCAKIYLKLIYIYIYIEISYYVVYHKGIFIFYPRIMITFDYYCAIYISWNSFWCFDNCNGN